MAWKWCDDPPPGYWACGDEPPDLCAGAPPPPVLLNSPPPWNPVYDVVLKGGATYYMKCRPGRECGAIVDQDPNVPDPSWHVVETVEVPSKGLTPGKWEVFCRTGGGPGGCQIALRKK